jgi:hypothetical protein
LVDGLGEDKPNALHRRHGQPTIHLLGYETVDVRRRQLRHKFATEGGNDVAIGNALVVRRSARCHLVAQYVGVPAVEELSDRQGRIRKRKAIVKLTLEQFEFLSNFCPSFCGDGLSDQSPVAAVT